MKMMSLPAVSLQELVEYQGKINKIKNNYKKKKKKKKMKKRKSFQYPQK